MSRGRSKREKSSLISSGFEVSGVFSFSRIEMISNALNVFDGISNDLDMK